MPKPETRLDEFVPVWQFGEHHSIRVAAPPAKVFDAVKHIRAGEITFFRTLTWIRRGGRKLPESILNAGNDMPLLDIATKSGFIYLANEPPRELVIGTMVIAPPGARQPDHDQPAGPPAACVLARVPHSVLPKGFCLGCALRSRA